jgi:hypothetical protein
MGCDICSGTVSILDHEHSPEKQEPRKLTADLRFLVSARS